MTESQKKKSKKFYRRVSQQFGKKFIHHKDKDKESRDDEKEGKRRDLETSRDSRKGKKRSPSTSSGGHPNSIRRTASFTALDLIFSLKQLVRNCDFHASREREGSGGAEGAGISSRDIESS